MKINKPKFWDQKISLYSLILFPLSILVKLVIVLKGSLLKVKNLMFQLFVAIYTWEELKDSPLFC